ncbi:MAG: ABC transporter permease [Clostridia bacterium]|nr:ABC transporter permease [Clostridia bacterium]
MKTLFRSLLLAAKKLSAMAGGLLPLTIALAAALVMFFTANRALNTRAPVSLRIGCVDLDKTEVSAELISAIKSANGSSVELIECADIEQVNKLMDGARIEGALIISELLEDNLRNGEAALEYLPAMGSSSAQAARELIAGEAVTLGSVLRAEKYFEKLTGWAPTAEEKRALYEEYRLEREREGSAVDRQSVFSDGSDKKAAETEILGAFYARYSGFSAFVIMLVLLMLGAFSCSKDEKNSSERIRSYSFGRSMGFLSNLFALMLLGLLMLALSFIPSRGASLIKIGAGIAYVFCASALSLLLGGLSGSARAELSSPLIAFLTALAGGCFADVSALGPSFKTLSLCTPQGQYLAALNGEAQFIPVLVALGLILLLLSRFLERAANRAVQAR